MLSSSPKRKRDILLTERVGTVRELCAAIAEQLYDATRPTPTNLDGLADVLKEFNVTRVTATFWMLSHRDTLRVEKMLGDLGVELVR